MKNNMYLVEYKLGEELVKKLFTDFESVFKFIQDRRFKHDVYKLDSNNNFVKIEVDRDIFRDVVPY